MSLPDQVSTHADPDGPTPSQTIGPFFRFGMEWMEAPDLVAPGSPGSVVLTGRVLDGAGEPVPDAMVEIWQADGGGELGGAVAGAAGAVAPAGVAASPAARALEFAGGGTSGDRVVAPTGGGSLTATWWGFGRCLTDRDGRYRFTTVVPGAVDDHQAPHIDMTVFARGLLQRLVTRVYFPDQPGNDADPALAALDPDRRGTLVARGEDFPPTSELTFDVRLQGDRETVFFVW